MRNYAIKIAKENQAELMILYVVSSLMNAVSNVLSMNGEPNEITAKNQLHELWQSLDEDEIEADLIVQCGDPFTKIMSCVNSQKNDVIIMGTSLVPRLPDLPGYLEKLPFRPTSVLC